MQKLDIIMIWFRLVIPALLVFLLLATGCFAEREPIPDTGMYEDVTELVQIPEWDGEAGESVSLQSSMETAITDVVKNSRKAVVTITSQLTTPDTGSIANAQEMDTVKRSGFLISDKGHVATISHHPEHDFFQPEVVTYDGKSYSAELIGTDPYSGITLLKITNGDSYPFIAFGNSDSLLVGEWAISLGIPVPDSRPDHNPYVSAGVVSSLDCMVEGAGLSRLFYPDLIQTDVIITPQSDGGPLLNAGGQVVGMNIYTPEVNGIGANHGHGYAIPGNKVVRMINYFASKDSMQLNYNIGLEMVPVTITLAERYHLPVKQGLFILGVNKDGPAYQSGILPGDVITRIGREIIYGETHAWAVLRQFNKGEDMPITFRRGDEEFETSIMLRKKRKSVESQ